LFQYCHAFALAGTRRFCYNQAAGKNPRKKGGQSMLDTILGLFQSGGETLETLVEFSQAMATLAAALESISAFFAPLLQLFEGLGGLFGA
jgi:hypothetical protein